MGYCSYEPGIYMHGPKADRERAFSFIKAFFENDDGELAKDPQYQAFREETDGLCGERGMDYDNTEDREMGMSGDAAKIEAWFCRSGAETSSDCLTPLFKAFPDIRFYINGYRDWFNNAHQLSSGDVEEAEYFQGKLCDIEVWDNTRKLWKGKITTIDEALKQIVDNEFPRALIFVPEKLRTTELLCASLPKIFVKKLTKKIKAG